MSLLSLTLATGACKKKQDDTGAAATQVKKTAEDVNDQAKDLRKTETDKDSTNKDINGAQADLQAAKADLTAAKEKYSSALKDRMQKLDIKIDELEKRTDAKSHQVAADLKARRDALSAKTADIKDRTAADWDAFTKNVDDEFDRLDKDANDALK
jgi:chromosome segregation ATPase